MINFYVRLSNLYMVIKNRMQQLKNTAFFAFVFFAFLSCPLNFDKEKWYYIYIEQLLTLAQFCDPDLEPCYIYHIYLLYLYIYLYLVGAPIPSHRRRCDKILPNQKKATNAKNT